MRSMIIFISIILLAPATFGEAMLIVCGNSPGEIYFVGAHATLPGSPVLYYSSNFGDSIEIHYNSGLNYFGELFPDPRDSTLYRTDGIHQYYSTDGGFHWNMVNSYSYSIYASGIISGEVYRRMSAFRLERTENYGVLYTPTACNGGPDSAAIHSAALGSDSGEVYLWGDHGKLYYSADYAENFTYLGDLYHTWGINPWTVLINGAESGEVFLYHEDSKIVYRSYNFGDNVYIIEDFPPMYNSWFGGIASTSEPGELYFYALRLDMMPGGTMHIYHTTDYFQSWTLREHIVPSSGIINNKFDIIPNFISMQIFPNPTNTSFNICYELNAMKDVRLSLYDILGNIVWERNMGLQSAGKYQIIIMNGQLPSGTYFLQLINGQSSIFRNITIIK